MKNISTVRYRRRRTGKTDYKKRLALLLSNKSRLVIRTSLKNISLQVAEYHPPGDKILASAHSGELEKFGWNINKGNIPAAYLTGLLFGKKMKEKKIGDVVLDIGMQRSIKASRIYAALKGVLDAGIDVPHSKEILPDENRTSGKHIQDHTKKEVQKMFTSVKEKILAK
ncbi:MAG: 50S ribosomal protein L18 [Candidatus Woesearchaeota archaeon]|nr:50S ribosomal protein L18 [Candidatus Woesearchaeota archaeon]